MPQQGSKSTFVTSCPLHQSSRYSKFLFKLLYQPHLSSTQQQQVTECPPFFANAAANPSFAQQQGVMNTNTEVNLPVGMLAINVPPVQQAVVQMLPVLPFASFGAPLTTPVSMLPATEPVARASSSFNASTDGTAPNGVGSDGVSPFPATFNANLTLEQQQQQQQLLQLLQGHQTPEVQFSSQISARQDYARGNNTPHHDPNSNAR
mmetsp:Transcript_1892/g.4989  ORF Transcript_1892/g.4989 Transcript_1892/m.4989 type:complete len:206 (+) Transcript_1892:493-1110(+)